jgi:hypothetical protein
VWSSKKVYNLKMLWSKINNLKEINWLINKTASWKTMPTNLFSSPYQLSWISTLRIEATVTKNTLKNSTFSIVKSRSNLKKVFLWTHMLLSSTSSLHHSVVPPIARGECRRPLPLGMLLSAAAPDFGGLAPLGMCGRGNRVYRWTWPHVRDMVACPRVS